MSRKILSLVGSAVLAILVASPSVAGAITRPQQQIDPYTYCDEIYMSDTERCYESQYYPSIDDFHACEADARANFAGCIGALYN